MKEKVIDIDTKLYEHELVDATMELVAQFGPYGEGNKEPIFLIENVIITNAAEIGRGEKTHLKLTASVNNRTFNIMQRGKGKLV